MTNDYGLLVTGNFPNRWEGGYKGVAWGYPWPLELVPEEKLSDEEKALQAEAEYPIMHYRDVTALTGDVRLVTRMLAACAGRRINCRILLCRGAIVFQPLKIQTATLFVKGASFLGFDLISESCDYSYLGDDFWGDPINEDFESYRPLLNGNKLFASHNDALEYLHFREEYIREKRTEAGVPLDGTVPLADLELEDGGDPILVEAHEISKEHWGACSV